MFRKFFQGSFFILLAGMFASGAVRGGSPFVMWNWKERTVPPGMLTAIVGTTVSSLTNVALYFDDRKIEDTIAYPPQYTFGFHFTNDIPGDYRVTVRSTNDMGMVVSSDPVMIHYPSRASARFIFPTNGATVFFGEDIRIQVEAILDHGAPTGMNIYDPDPTHPYHMVETPPYEVVWRARRPGSYTFFASPYFECCGYGESTERITLEILPESVAYISEQPLGTIREEGRGFTLGVKAVSRGEQRFQWLRNGEPIPGATNELYLIESLTATDEGYYSVVVDNFAGRTSSSVASVEVNSGGGGQVLFANNAAGIDAPILGIEEARQVIVLIEAGPSLDRMRFQQKNVVTGDGYFNAGPLVLSNVPPGGKAFVQIHTKKHLLFDSAGASKIFEITTGVNEPAPLRELESFVYTNWNSSHLDVKINESSRSNVHVGATAELKATASLNFQAVELPRTNVWLQWRKNGQDIVGETNEVLRVENVRIEDAGWYSALVTDGTKVAQAGIALSVLHAMTLTPTEAGELKLRTRPGGRYSIETSADLSRWTLWKTVTSEGEELKVALPAGNDGTRFYRAIAEP